MPIKSSDSAPCSLLWFLPAPIITWNDALYDGIQNCPHNVISTVHLALLDYDIGIFSSSIWNKNFNNLIAWIVFGWVPYVVTTQGPPACTLP